MSQAFDNRVPTPDSARQDWLALLARAPLLILDRVLTHHAETAPTWLRRPETGLMMIQGRIGGTGERFNLGEVTVTRCALRLAKNTVSDTVGVSYILGRDHLKAKLAAIADALLQDPDQFDIIESDLLVPVRQYLQQQQAHRQQNAQSTKVEFFTVARQVKATNIEEGA